MDARVKLVFALAVLCMVISYKGFAFPLMVLACCLGGCLMIRVPLRKFLLRFSEPMLIASVVIILKFFFSGQEALFSARFAGITITGYTDGLREGLAIACRIMGAVSVMALLGFTTSFTDLMSALSWLRVPKGFVEILMFAYRYIFVIFEDAQVIYTAQKNRLGYAGVRRGLVSFGTLAGSLVLKAFERSHAITVSMIQRGYDGNIPMLQHRPFRPLEVFVSILTVCVVGVAWKIL